jgi:putative transposase
MNHEGTKALRSFVHSRPSSPRKRTVVRGMIRFVAGARQAPQPFCGYFLVVETQKGEPGVRYQNTVLGELLKVLPRRAFASIVSQHKGDRYVKEFDSWDHLVTLLFGQLGGISSLRELVEVWNAQAVHHYHLGAGPVCRATVSDANQRRPSAIFAEVFGALTGMASRTLRRQSGEVLRLIDATPIPLTTLHEWAKWNGRTRGLKAHVVYDPDADRPVHLEITSSTVNDVTVARDLGIEPGRIYVFDKAYVDYRWWCRLHEADCIFVTRPKTNVPFTRIKKRRLSKTDRAASIISDATVRLASQQKTRLPIELRRIEVQRDDGTILTILSNDLERSAAEIAGLYRKRWQIELLFRWIKQHLKIRAFYGRSENAIRLQIFAALIAYLLLRIAAAASRSALPALRFANLVRSRLFERSPLARIDKPRWSTRRASAVSPNQLAFAYA